MQKTPDERIEENLLEKVSSKKMKKIDIIMKKYLDRKKQGYEYTSIGEIISDLYYIKPKRRKQ